MARAAVFIAALAATCLFAGNARADEIPGGTLVPPKTGDEIWRALKTKDTQLAPDCKTRKVVNTKLIKTLKNDNWAEQWTLDRCGARVIYTFVFTKGAKDSVEVRFIPPASDSDQFPGETLGSSQLKRDTWAAIEKYDQGLAPSCHKRKVKDTAVTEPSDGGKWSEQWTIDRCGEAASYRVAYTSDPKGGTSMSIQSNAPAAATKPDAGAPAPAAAPAAAPETKPDSGGTAK